MSQEELLELAITRLIHRRLEEQDCLGSGDRGSVAYRIAELMVTAKSLYTEVLPRLVGDSPGEGLYEELAGLRMHLIHLRDLVGDFDDAFLEAMTHEREVEGVGPFAVKGYEEGGDVLAYEDEDGYEEEESE